MFMCPIVFLLVAPTFASTAPQDRLNADLLLPVMADLLMKPHLPNGERAAFIRVSAGGDVRCQLWPLSLRRRSASFTGFVPPDTIAVVHTHPEDAGPTPSSRDVEEARRIGIPIFVVTRMGVRRVDPDGAVSVVTRGRAWFSDRGEVSAPAQCESVSARPSGNSRDIRAAVRSRRLEDRP
jgi:hypothetical protein